MQELSGDGRQPPAGARFVLLSNLPVHGVDRGHSVELVTWRLVAGNNRSLGKAAGMFGSVAGCLDDATRLHQSIADSRTTVEFHSAVDQAASYWSWTVSLDGTPVARSTHNYQRRLECLRAQANFLDAVRLTVPTLLPVRRLGRRLGVCRA